MSKCSLCRKRRPADGRKQCQPCRDRANANRQRLRKGRVSRVVTIIRGESIVQRCLREARTEVSARMRNPGVNAYGTWQHDMRARFDAALGEAFRRRLVEAGITVEGM